MADWPGLGKKGEKVKAYWDGKFTQDGNLFVGHFYGGSGSGNWLLAYDAGAKQITTLWVISGGSVQKSSVFKRDGKWTDKGSRSNSDGTKYEFENTLTISDNGSTATWTGETIIAGKKADDRHDVWRRVSK